MSNLDTLHTIYIVTLTAAIIMFIITIVLFFVFDIRHIIGRVFGFSEKKAIKEMEANTSFTSQLNSKYNRKMKDKVFTTTGSLKRYQTPAERMGLVDQQTAATGNGGHSEPGGYSDPEGYQETVALNNDAEPLTTRLFQGESEDRTTVLNAGQDVGFEVSKANVIEDFQFMIVKQIMLVHTNESI